MFTKAARCDLLWDLSLVEGADRTQRWVLSAMQKNGPDLVNMLWRMLGNEQDVCDAYQSTFLQLAHCERYRKPNHIKAYIFRTANNVAITMLRRKIAERKILPLAINDKSFHSPMENLDTMHLTQTLRYYIAQLPDNLREVVILRDLAELRYQQVARILGISPGTARVYRCKAIQLLAAWMNKTVRH